MDMNNKKILRALIWREFIEGKRLLLMFIFPAICLGVVPLITLYSILDRLIEISEYSTIDSLKNFYAINQMFFIPPMIILFFSMSFFSRISVERNEKTIAVLMAMQIKPQMIWTAKVFVANCFSCAVYLASCVIYVVGVKVAFDINIYFSIRDILGIFIVSPLIGFTLAIFFALLHWVVKNSEMISFLALLITIGGIFPLSSKLQNMVITFPLMAIILFVSALIFMVCLRIIKKIPNEYTANL
jgi:hypothetical protein